jgi:hypothetical protein
MTIDEYIRALDEEVYEHEVERQKVLERLKQSVRGYTSFALDRRDTFRRKTVREYDAWENQQAQLSDWLKELVRRRNNEQVV